VFVEELTAGGNADKSGAVQVCEDSLLIGLGLQLHIVTNCIKPPGEGGFTL
jgi:hypothetical protein